MPRNDDAPNTGWQTAVEISSVPRFKYPFQGLGDTSGYIVERDYVQNGDYFSPLALDTADATYTSAFLFEETEPSPIGNGLVEWTRKYGTVPSTFSYNTSESYSFIGYYDSYDTNSSYRDTYPTPTIVKVTNYFIKSTDIETDFAFNVVDDQSFVSLNNRNEKINYVDGTSSPSISAYQALVTAGSYINVRDSLITKAYGAGNIYRKQRFETKAK